jgi:hypothetical protein
LTVYAHLRYLYVCLTVYVHLSVCLFDCLYVHLSVFLFACLSVCLPVYVHLSVCLFACLCPPGPLSQFIYLFSFALTKKYTKQVQQFIYMRHNKRLGNHNSLHQLLWAL